MNCARRRANLPSVPKSAFLRVLALLLWLCLGSAAATAQLADDRSAELQAVALAACDIDTGAGDGDMLIVSLAQPARAPSSDRPSLPAVAATAPAGSTPFRSHARAPPAG